MMDRPLSFEEFQKCIQSGVFPGAVVPLGHVPPINNPPAVPDGIEIVVEDDDEESNKPRDSYEETFSRRPRPISLNQSNANQIPAPQPISSMPLAPDVPLHQNDFMLGKQPISKVGNLPPPPNLTFPLPITGPNFTQNQIRPSIDQQNLIAAPKPANVSTLDGKFPIFPPPPMPDFKSMPGASNQNINLQPNINFSKVSKDPHLQNFASVASELAHIKDQLMRIDPFGSVSSSKSGGHMAQGTSQGLVDQTSNRTNIGRTLGNSNNVALGGLSLPNEGPKYGTGKNMGRGTNREDSRDVNRENNFRSPQIPKDISSGQFDQDRRRLDTEAWRSDRDDRDKFRERQSFAQRQEIRNADRRNETDNINRTQDWQGSKYSHEMRDNFNSRENFRSNRENALTSHRDEYDADRGNFISREKFEHSRDNRNSFPSNNQENKQRDFREEPRRTHSKERYDDDRKRFDNSRDERHHQASSHVDNFVGYKSAGPQEVHGRSAPGRDSIDFNRGPNNANRREAPRASYTSEKEQFSDRPSIDYGRNNAQSDRHPRAESQNFGDAQAPRLAVDRTKPPFVKGNYGQHNRNNSVRNSDVRDDFSRNSKFPTSRDANIEKRNYSNRERPEPPRNAARDDFNSSKRNLDGYDRNDAPKNQQSFKGNVTTEPKLHGSGQQFLPPPPPSSSFKPGEPSSSLQSSTSKSNEGQSSRSSSVVAPMLPPPLPPFAVQQAGVGSNSSSSSNCPSDPSMQNIFPQSQQKAVRRPLSVASANSLQCDTAASASASVHESDETLSQKFEERRANEASSASGAVEFEVVEEVVDLTLSESSNDVTSLGVNSSEAKADEAPNSNKEAEEKQRKEEKLASVSSSSPGSLKRPPPFAPLVPEDVGASPGNADASAVQKKDVSPRGVKRGHSPQSSVSSALDSKRKPEADKCDRDHGPSDVGKGIKRTVGNVDKVSADEVPKTKEPKTDIVPQGEKSQPQRNEQRPVQLERMPAPSVQSSFGGRTPQNQMRPGPRNAAPRYPAANIRMTGPDMPRGTNFPPNRMPSMRPPHTAPGSEVPPRMALRGPPPANNNNCPPQQAMRAPLQRGPGSSAEPFRGQLQRMPPPPPAIRQPLNAPRGPVNPLPRGAPIANVGTNSNIRPMGAGVGVVRPGAGQSLPQRTVVAIPEGGPRVKGPEVTQRIVRPFTEPPPTAAVEKRAAPVSSAVALTKPVAPHVKLASEEGKVAASPSASHANETHKKESEKPTPPVQATPSKETTGIGVPSQVSRPATREDAKPSDNVVSLRAPSAKPVQTARPPMSQRLGPVNPVTSIRASTAPSVTLRREVTQQTPSIQGPLPKTAPEITVSQTPGDKIRAEFQPKTELLKGGRAELHEKIEEAGNSPAKTVAVKVDPVIQNRTLGARTVTAVPVATINVLSSGRVVQMPAPTPDSSKTSPQKVTYSHRTVGPQSSSTLKPSITNNPGTSASPRMTVGDNTKATHPRLVAPGISVISAPISQRTLSSASATRTVSQNVPPSSPSTAKAKEQPGNGSVSSNATKAIAAPFRAGVVADLDLKATTSSLMKSNDVVKEITGGSVATSATSASTVIKLKRTTTETKKDTTCDIPAQTPKVVDSASEKSNVDKSKTSAVVNETTPKDKQVDVKPVSAPPKPVITSLKPIRPVAKSLAAPPPFSVQKPPAPPHTSPQIVRSTGTTAQKPPTTDPNNEPVSQKIVPDASKAATAAVSANGNKPEISTNQQPNKQPLPSVQSTQSPLSKPSTTSSNVASVGKDQLQKENSSSSSAPVVQVVKKVLPPGGIDSATLQLRIDNDVAAVKKASAKAKFKCNDCAIGHTDKESFLKHLQSVEHFERLKARLQQSDVDGANK